MDMDSKVGWREGIPRLVGGKTYITHDSGTTPRIGSVDMWRFADSDLLYLSNTRSMFDHLSHSPHSLHLERISLP